MRAAAWLALALVIAAFVSAPTALADIKTFNEAVLRKDFAAASSAANEAWPLLDKSRVDAPVIAREFAFVAMVAGQPAAAEPIARWLAEEGAARAGSAVDPRTAAVLFAWSQLGDGRSPQARAALMSALAARAVEPDPQDRISPMAADALAAMAWSLNAWAEADQAAGHAARLAEALGPDGALMRDSARLTGIAARFVGSPRAEEFEAMSRLFQDLVAAAPEPPGPAASAPGRLRDRAAAWSAAMRAYFESAAASDTPSPAFDRARQVLREVEIAQCGAGCINARRAEAGEPPMCAVRYNQRPPLTYPAFAAERGLAGAVFLGLDVNAAGAITEARLLAAVPSDTFPERTLERIRAWTVSEDPQRRIAGCTLAGTRTMMVVYRMGAD